MTRPRTGRNLPSAWEFAERKEIIVMCSLLARSLTQKESPIFDITILHIQIGKRIIDKMRHEIESRAIVNN